MDAARVLDDIPLAIDPDEVLRFQGYKAGVDVPSADVRALFDEALALGRTLMRPRAVLRTYPVTRDGDRLQADGVTLTIPQIAQRWGAIEELTAGVCTIGHALERHAADLWEARELPLAMMLDSVGSGAVESLAEYVNDQLCGEGIARGVKVTNRVSPGYGGWDVAEQSQLWRLCPGDPIGVTLNESCFMTPTKTITILVGAGPDARVDDYFSQCARCWMRDCAYRRAPSVRTVRR
ncbi:MAG TPA: vitamin B12 dependent-methionine synthase activation domain-containing protein [Terriglobales bacterium]|nr:vitamin B12 dependent-methionine synthase activation domain-containing protein [Terriglobales bacterium]